jgi:hypothetical protein
MNPDLQNDLLEFKVWYQHRLEFINAILKAVENIDDPSKEDIAQLRKSRILHMEKSARMIVDIYSKYGFYPDLY